MIEIKDKVKCCGCWACVNACPKNCIQMVSDDEGFHYPVADRSICIECGKCDKVCPLLKPRLEEKPLLGSFVIQNKDREILRHSTSGGFYTALSKYIISLGGVVFGAAYDDGMVLRHTYSESYEGCMKFRGSKYVQSLIGDSYKQTKSFLDSDRYVAFSGTPCQVAGLVGYLGNRQYEKLILVDFVCRGTPSPKVLNKYLSWHNSRHGGQPISWLSRDKYFGYDMSSATILYKDGSCSHHGTKSDDLMLNAYFQGLISRPSCYDCHFKTLHRLSDLTLFDCWNAKSVSAAFLRNGATNVFVHSEKGEAVFGQIKNEFILAESDVEKIIKRDGIMIFQNPPKSSKREDFFSDMNAEVSIPQLWDKYCKTSILNGLVSKIKPLLYRLGLWSLYMGYKQR